jgi:molybdate transport system permease protein
LDLFPLWNSIRVAGIATAVTFFAGIAAAWRIARAPRLVKGVCDCVLTLPMVLPPTVVGFFLLRAIGPLGPVGALAARLGFPLVMTWYSAIFATAIVSFPLMYRAARGAFEGFDASVFHAGQTLGFSDTYLFWRVVMPNCRSGILAGAVLAFARALGEYGATSMVTGYIPGRTATISTAVYQLWREGNDEMAYRWVAVNFAISFVVLAAANMLNGPLRPKYDAGPSR